MPTDLPRELSSLEIKKITSEVKELIRLGKYRLVSEELKPILEAKVPFAKLDRVGRIIASQPVQLFKIVNLLNEIAATNHMGAYVVAAQALVSLQKVEFDLTMKKAHEYIIQGDVWHVCDNIGERCLGQGILNHFEESLPWLKKFLSDKNPWVRRSVGVGIHVFSKNNKAEPKKTKILLDLIEPHIEEKQIDIVKGIGWGLKTIGKHHPEILSKFMRKQMAARKKISGLMMSKAKTYLNQKRKIELEGYPRTLQN